MKLTHPKRQLIPAAFEPSEVMSLHLDIERGGHAPEVAPEPSNESKITANRGLMNLHHRGQLPPRQFLRVKQADKN